MLAKLSFLASESGTTQKRPTKRAPDVWESVRFRSIFLASVFSTSQALSTPAHTQVTQTVRRLANKPDESQGERKCLSEQKSIILMILR